MSPYSKALLKTILVAIAMFIVMNILMVQFNLRAAVFNSVLFDIDHPNYRLVQISSLTLGVLFTALCAYLGWLLSGRKNRNKEKRIFFRQRLSGFEMRLISPILSLPDH